MENIPENIKFLMLKWKTETLSDEERRILDAWYNEELPDEIFWYGEQEDSLGSRMHTNILSRANIAEEVAKGVRHITVTTWAASIAALLILCLLGAIYLWKRSDMPVTLVSTETKKAEITKLILPDQSIVWLKGDSKLYYPENFTGQTREVELIGEALFEVVKDKKKPFIIHTGDYFTKVLGTSFNLRVDPKDGKLDLSVLTGTVEVTKKRKGLVLERKYTVEANETLRTDDNDQLVPAEVVPTQLITTITKGTEYDMNFISTPVEDIMSRFEKKFEVSFEGYTGEYSSCRVTANLTDQSLETSLKLLSLSINANYKIEDNMIKLTGGGCF
ncbi:FecR family protein [Sphingobacterium alkalisoli]|uniref:FecR family protein n=1 Tax=Sphingobacterium alkalisoli TaxID=1874115 RepID=A0A4U0GXE8_9SPHI|nr:FecR family protein [Sphingobacterium alkalisoli]TJY63696.1 FecR family protein [Sphingobacterium alkalisoli]GGH25496.1 hypothetical protein GCM10011418_34120 [Sphingobacterium alkalisoli]